MNNENFRKGNVQMDGPVKRLLRLWEKRRNKKRGQKRISNLIANSNCIGTTANLFRDEWARAIARNLKTNKKARQQTDLKNKK